MWSLAARLDRSLPRGDIPPSELFERAASRAMSRAPEREPSRAGADAPDGYLVALPKGQLPTPIGRALLLQVGDDRFVPVFVGSSEALAYQHQLEGTRPKRPLTHDLLVRVLELFGGEVAQVRIERLEGDVYVSTVVLRIRNDQREIDARASDAIVLAMGAGVPIYVSPQVVRRAARGITDVAHSSPNSDPSQSL